MNELSRDNILNATSAELDEMLAIHVMRWHKDKKRYDMKIAGFVPVEAWFDKQDVARCWTSMWCPHRNMTQVMEALKKSGYYWCIDWHHDLYGCCLYKDKELTQSAGDGWCHDEERPELTICRALLLAAAKEQQNDSQDSDRPQQ